MNNRNPFLDIDEKEENPFSDIPVEDKKQKPTLREINENYDVLGKPFRKLGKAGGMVLQDIAGLLPKAIEAATYVPQELMGEALNVAYDRPRLGRQAVGMGMTALNNIATLPPAMGYYLARIGLLPQSAKKMPYADFSKEIQDFVGEKRPGDTLALNLPAIMTGLLGGTKLVRSIGKGKGVGATALEEELLNAKESQEKAISQSKQITGKSDPDLMYYGITKNKEKLNELDKSLETLNKNINEIEIPPEAKGETAHLENAFNLNKATEEAASHIPQAEALHENAVRQRNKIENEIGKDLRQGATHDIELGNATRPGLEKLKKEGTELYEEVKKDVADKGIVIKEGRAPQEIANDYATLHLKEKGDVSKTEAGKKLIQELDNVGKKEIVPASQFMSMVKAVKGYMREAYKKANEPLINEDKRMFWNEQATQAENQLNQMNAILEKNIGTENFDKLIKANNYWRENIIPLWKDPNYWKIMNGEKITSGDLSSHFRGGLPGSSTQIIKNIIKQNPKALTHMVGERFEKGIENIINPNEELAQYIDLMPDLKNKINNYHETNQTVGNADIAQQKAKFHHAVMKERSKEANDIAEKKQKEINESQKLRGEKIANKEKLSQEKKEKQIERNKILDELRVHQETMEKLNSEKEKVKSIEEKKRVNRKIEQEKLALKNKVSIWKKGNKITRTLFFGDYGIHSIKKIIKLISGNRD